MMPFIKVARADELPPGGKLKVVIEDQTILLTNIDGAYFAINNRCPHMGGSLFDGVLNGDTIACPRHKTVFSVKTGKMVEAGRMAFLPVKAADAQAYPVKEENGELFVAL